MFGHNEPKDENNDTQTVAPTTDSNLNDGLPDPIPSATLNEPATTSDYNGAPAVNSDSAPASTPPVPQPLDEPEITATATPDPVTDDSDAKPTANPVATDDLLDLKKDALEELAPLVDHLDQTPEERFKTTMMMIQATDASGLIQNAYAAAKEITDEKVRAQALLDIVNEINYFTQANKTE